MKTLICIILSIALSITFAKLDKQIDKSMSDRIHNSQDDLINKSRKR